MDVRARTVTKKAAVQHDDRRLALEVSRTASPSTDDYLEGQHGEYGPYSSLVHVFSIPFGYLRRGYIQYRSSNPRATLVHERARKASKEPAKVEQSSRIASGRWLRVAEALTYRESCVW